MVINSRLLRQNVLQFGGNFRILNGLKDLVYGHLCLTACTMWTGDRFGDD